MNLTLVILAAFAVFFAARILWHMRPEIEPEALSVALKADTAVLVRAGVPICRQRD